MSLDVYLEESQPTEVYWRNITHNVGKMAAMAGLYDCCWRPDEHGITKAKQLIVPLAEGLTALLDDPARFKLANPENGWVATRALWTSCARTWLLVKRIPMRTCA